MHTRDRTEPGTPRPFDAARRAADLVAAVDRDRPWPLDEVKALLVAHGEPAPVELDEGDLVRLRAPAAELRQVFAATDTASAAAALNRILARYGRPPRLTRHGGTPWHLHVDADDDGDWVDWFAASSAHALAVLLAERQAPPGGVCAAPDCVHPFVDDGRGGPRRYCSQRCATRVRVARHRGQPPG
jgi:predicted RNA-binding Zn ribbon-like protein